MQCTTWEMLDIFSLDDWAGLVARSFPPERSCSPSSQSAVSYLLQMPRLEVCLTTSSV